MGWLYCNGRALNTSDYVQLFNVIGYSFGGSGSTFYLPDPQGRVPGFVGQATVPDVSSNTWVLGDISGEETHQLTLPEMPIHNHDISDLSGTTVSIQDNPFGFTDASGSHNHTGFVLQSGSHSHTATDSGHTHGGVPNQQSTALNGASNNTGNGATTGLGYANITVGVSGEHIHVIPTQPNHSHGIRPAGGDQRHNNIQPTIWIGNLFIYSGRQWVAATPQSRAIQGANPVPNSNRYRPQGPGINLY